MQKSGPRPPVGRNRFLRLRLPEHFVVESVTRFGHWIDGNSYLAPDCKRLADGCYVRGHRAAGGPLYLRCVA